MNALITLLTVGLLTLSTEGYAAPPPIEEAPADVDGYIRCIQDFYATNRWQAGTIAGCRANNPAVRSLRDCDYVSVTFSRAQSRIYEQSRKQWIDFDKALRTQLLSRKLNELFQAANPLTAYSFKRVASDLDARFSELNEEPFSWYPATKVPYTTVSGSSLASLHSAELAQFTRCLETAISQLSASRISRSAFDSNVDTCSSEISARNGDASKALYQPQVFRSVAEQTWAPIASQRVRTQDAAVIPLAKKESESSWYVTLLKLICIMIMGVGGLFTFWNLVNRVPATISKKGGRRSRRKRNEHEDSQPRGRNQEGKKLDLGTFMLKHRKISSMTTNHLCASCMHWTGKRTPHPVNREPYVKLDAVGECVKKRAGSPYGMKSYKDGFQCKDFSDIGY